MKTNSITKRWVRGSLLITIAVLFIFEIIFVFYLRSAYYSGARSAMMSRVNTLAGQLTAMTEDSDAERSLMLRRLTEEFSEKSEFEFMLLAQDGSVLSTASGFVPSYADKLDDFAKARASVDGIGEYIGTGGGSERLMAVSYLVPDPAGGIVAVRFVTSLAGIDSQMGLMIMLSFGIVLLVLFFSVLSGTYFIRSIVMPLGKVEQTATRIAAGDFDARIENKYNDEIGRLCDTINYMAGELAKTEQMKNEFISSVSHELRTPLTSIKGWTETLLRMDDPSDENHKKGLRIITSETDRLYNMVEELLDFSRIQNGAVKLETELLDLVAELSDVLLMVGQRAVFDGVALEFNEPELPCPVLADKNRLRQVFLNLLDNALKYSPRGSTIHVRLTAKDNAATVVIADEGAGIPPEDLASVKLKFFKGRGAARGSGIGLAVVDELVTLHGGAFDITSSYGKGTTAIVRLPMKISAATLPAQSEAEQSSLQDAPQQYGERITQKGTIEQ